MLPGTVNVTVPHDPTQWTADVWRQIGDAMASYGDAYKDIEGVVYFKAHIRSMGGVFDALAPLPMPKLCDQTLKQAAKAIEETLSKTSAERMLGGGGASSGGGTGTTTGIIGWSPVYMTGMVCAGDVCRYDTVLVRYEPIYGPIPGERQYTDKVT